MSGTTTDAPAPDATSSRPVGDAPARRLDRLLHPTSPRRWLLAAALAAGSGALSGQVLAYGPLLTRQAVIALVLAVLVGLAAGRVTRSRWALLAAPVAHVAAMESARVGATGPSVDAVYLGTPHGVIAFLSGRGVYGLLVVIPMVVGAVYGAALARRSGPSRAPATRRGARLARGARHATSGLAAAGVAALAVGLVLPAHVPPMTGADGRPLPGSIAELTKVTLGGHDQWIEVRAADPDTPVLLFLSGGPGQSSLPFTRVLLDELARDMVVVDWDQRGQGKSYPALDRETLTLERAIADTVELTDHLRRRFGEQKIYLAGESWGTTLGVLTVQRHPERYHAWIGSGQMVSQRETDRRLYDDVLAYAARTGDTALAERMRGYGPPPYRDLWAYAVVMSQYDRLAPHFTIPAETQRLGEDNKLYAWGIGQPEYTLLEKTFLLRGFLDMGSRMYPQLQGLDFRRDVPRLAVPVYLFQGTHELASRSALVEEWYAALQAPRKRIWRFDRSGHSPAMEECGRFRDTVVGTVLPETYPSFRPEAQR